MSLREEWEFSYSVSSILQGARAKLEYHSRRVVDWQRSQDEVEAQVADSGIEIKHHEVTGGHRAEAVIETTLASRLNECQAKLSKHQYLVEAYGTWIAVLESQPQDEELPLEHDDVLYFGLDKLPAESQEAAQQ